MPDLAVQRSQDFMKTETLSAHPLPSPHVIVKRGTILQPDGSMEGSLRREFVDEFFSRQVAAISGGSTVLDLGGHRPPRRGRFDVDRYGLSVRSANISASRRPDVQTDASSLPFLPESFDAIICAELLEHVPDPLPVLREAHRTLRPHGVLLISVPFLFHIHADPHDYGRYTDQYWKENLDRIGFREVVIEKQGLFWSVIVDMMRGWLCEYKRTGHLRSDLSNKLATMLIRWAKKWALETEQAIPQADERYISRYATGFGIRAVKP